MDSSESQAVTVYIVFLFLHRAADLSHLTRPPIKQTLSTGRERLETKYSCYTMCAIDTKLQFSTRSFRQEPNFGYQSS